MGEQCTAREVKTTGPEHFKLQWFPARRLKRPANKVQYYKFFIKLSIIFLQNKIVRF